MTFTLQAAAFSDPQNGPQARASGMAPLYVPIESLIYSAFEQLAAERFLPAALSRLPQLYIDCVHRAGEAEVQLAVKPAAADAPIFLDRLEKELSYRLAGGAES